MIPSSPLLSAVTGPFKRAQLGLFQGKSKQYGNNVPFSKRKTRRTWLPNVQHKYLFSETLEQEVRLKITTRALKTIKKYGGLDNYVLNTKASLLAWEGMRVRLLVQQRLAERQRQAQSQALQSETGVEAVSGSEGQGAVEVKPEVEIEEASTVEAAATEPTSVDQSKSNEVADALAELQSAPTEHQPASTDTPTTTTSVTPSTTPPTATTASPPSPTSVPKVPSTSTLLERQKAQLAKKVRLAKKEQDKYDAFLVGKRPTLDDARKLREKTEKVVGRSDARTTIAYLQSQQQERKQLLGM